MGGQRDRAPLLFRNTKTIAPCPPTGSSSLLTLTYVISGPLGGGPYAIVLYANSFISDLRWYGIGVAVGGGGNLFPTFMLPSTSMERGERFYVTKDANDFADFFGFGPNLTNALLDINGDDAVQLFFAGNVVDVYGDPNVDGTGTAWEYVKGYANRRTGTGPDGNSFMLSHWYISGLNALLGDTIDTVHAIGRMYESPTGSLNLTLSYVISGPLGGGPYAIALYAEDYIWDLSWYGIGVAVGGGGNVFPTFMLPSTSMEQGERFYVTKDANFFADFFGFGPNLTNALLDINGDDAVQLFFAGNVVDVYGDPNVDGTGTAWEYVKGYANRRTGTGPDGNSFMLSHWYISGLNALLGDTIDTVHAIGRMYESPTGSLNLTLSYVISGPLGGGPYAIALYAEDYIWDLSWYGIGVAVGGGGNVFPTFMLPSTSMERGERFYVTKDANFFADFFGFGPNLTNALLDINGDDAVQLFFAGNVVDVYGDPNVDGTGTAWEYVKGYANRRTGTGPDGNSFMLSHWYISGLNALLGDTIDTVHAIGRMYESPTGSLNLTLSYVISGPLGGGPYAIALYAEDYIWDLSWYGIGVAVGGGGNVFPTFMLPSTSMEQGERFYVTKDANDFADFFGFGPNLTNALLDINGDDAVQLFFAGNVVDVYGDPNVDGTGTAWEYVKGYANRRTGTGPDGNSFMLSHWYISGLNALLGDTIDTVHAIGRMYESPTGSLNLTLSYVISGPLGGGPYAIALYAEDYIWDLSWYGIGVAVGGGGNVFPTFMLPSTSMEQGERFYVTKDANFFADFFGFGPNLTNALLDINGDDAVQLFFAGNVVDVYGDPNVDGTGTAWEYVKGYANRRTGTGPDGNSFMLSHWYISGLNALLGDTIDTVHAIGRMYESPTGSLNLTLSYVISGPLGGGPYAIALYAEDYIWDLSWYGIGVAVGGGGNLFPTFMLPSTSMERGERFYVTKDANDFADFFGFGPNLTNALLDINGDDAVQLFFAGNVVDVYGDPNVDGTGTAWEYVKGYANRRTGTGPDGNSFMLSHWYISGLNALLGDTIDTVHAIGRMYESPTGSLNLTLSYVISGPLGGGPYAIALYAEDYIWDLSWYGIGVAVGGGGNVFPTFMLPSTSMEQGERFYVTKDANFFADFFGFGPNLTNALLDINGDDAVQLFFAGNVVDVYGDPNVDGTGTAWEYVKGYANRRTGTGPDGNSFMLSHWYISGLNALLGDTIDTVHLINQAFDPPGGPRMSSVPHLTVQFSFYAGNHPNHGRWESYAPQLVLYLRLSPSSCNVLLPRQLAGGDRAWAAAQASPIDGLSLQHRAGLLPFRAGGVFRPPSPPPWPSGEGSWGAG